MVFMLYEYHTTSAVGERFTVPPHAFVATITLAIAAVAAAFAITYAAARATRATLRWPLLAISVAAVVLTTVTGQLGGSLLDAVQATGSAAEIAVAQQHAHGSDVLTVSLYALLVLELATVWKALSPRKERRNAGATIGAVLLVVTAVAVIVTGVTVLVQALEAVTAGHPTWTG
jgi:hypothetical protein